MAGRRVKNSRKAQVESFCNITSEAFGARPPRQPVPEPSASRPFPLTSRQLFTRFPGPPLRFSLTLRVQTPHPLPEKSKAGERGSGGLPPGARRPNPPPLRCPPPFTSPPPPPRAVCFAGSRGASPRRNPAPRWGRGVLGWDGEGRRGRLGASPAAGKRRALAARRSRAASARLSGLAAGRVASRLLPRGVPRGSASPGGPEGTEQRARPPARAEPGPRRGARAGSGSFCGQRGVGGGAAHGGGAPRQSSAGLSRGCAQHPSPGPKGLSPPAPPAAHSGQGPTGIWVLPTKNQSGHWGHGEGRVPGRHISPALCFAPPHSPLSLRCSPDTEVVLSVPAEETPLV